jgi:GcrA cell cycle regulator
MSAHAIRPAAHVWQPADDERLAELWNEGLSSVAIGKRMACSKGSVLGRAHRLELPKRPSPIPNPEQRLKTATERANALARAVARLNSTIAAARMAAEAPVASGQGKHPTEPETPPAGNVEAVEAMSARLKNWIDTVGAPRDCQWPIGHPKRPGFRFCLNETEPTKPYCYGHCRIAYINFRNTNSANDNRVYVPHWLQSR